MVGLSAEECAILAEESTLLERARAAREIAAAAAVFGRGDVELVRALRAEATTASEDDLSALLHELSVRQTLLARPAAGPE